MSPALQSTVFRPTIISAGNGLGIRTVSAEIPHPQTYTPPPAPSQHELDVHPADQIVMESYQTPSGFGDFCKQGNTQYETQIENSMDIEPEDPDCQHAAPEDNRE